MKLHLRLSWAVLLVVSLGLVLIGAQFQAASRGQLVEIIVPAGTQARIEAGETVAVMPTRLEMRVGDLLRIDNRDVADQFVGPYFVRAGEVMEIKFGAPGVYSGLCPLTPASRYELVITS